MLDTFGSLPDGRPVHRVVLGGGSGPGDGAELHLLTLGSTVHRLVVTGGDGVRRDVVLGYPDVASYVAGGDYVGAVVGRYANRIARGRFELDGEVHVVGAHDRGNSLHGGPDGFDQRLWDLVEVGPDEDATDVRRAPPRQPRRRPGLPRHGAGRGPLGGRR